jgi:transposase InsO family protein
MRRELQGRGVQADKERVGKIWVGDITYIPTNEGRLYLAVDIDALTMAWFRRSRWRHNPCAMEGAG